LGILGVGPRVPQGDPRGPRGAQGVPQLAETRPGRGRGGYPSEIGDWSSGIGERI